jgi:glycosyltransferase involved in cell wall biosynthesis
VVYDSEQIAKLEGGQSDEQDSRVPASFTGFLNQTRVSEAYIAADCLVLPSDYGETWGLVVNEAMASGLPCIISNRCGSAEDLGNCAGNQIFAFGDCEALAQSLKRAALMKANRLVTTKAIGEYSFTKSVTAVTEFATHR